MSQITYGRKDEIYVKMLEGMNHKIFEPQNLHELGEQS